MQTTRICFVRHGETAWNTERRIQGQLDVPLSAAGHGQARAAANALVQEEFAAIYSSDLSRARQTAAAAAHLLKMPVQLNPALRERDYGIFQTLTYEEARLSFPGEFARHARRDPDFAFPGGESLSRFAARVTCCVDELVERHRGRQFLVFTHGGVLDVLHRHASGKPLSAPRDFEIPNAALNWLEVSDCRWSILAWADRDHLTEALDEA